MSSSLPANSPPGFDPIFDVPQGAQVFSGYKGRTYLGPAVSKDMFDRCEPVSFGDALPSTIYASHDGDKHNFGASDGQQPGVKSSAELQIPFDPNAPLTPRLLGREPSPRTGDRRVPVQYHSRDGGAEFGRTKDDGDEDWSGDFGDAQALYLGVNGELYDALYEPLSRSLRIRGDLDSNPTKYFQQQQNTRTFEVSPFPMPEIDHVTFFEWEQDVLVWKDRTEKQLQGVRLANATGRHVYRPKQGVPSIERKVSSDHLISTPPDTLMSLPNSDPTSAGSGDGATNTVGGTGGNASGGAVGVGSTKYHSSSSPMRSLTSADGRGRRDDDDLHDSETPSWDAVLVPAEPNPAHYACYEDYATAMMRWSLLVAQTAQKIPPAPRQLPSLLQLTNHSIISPTPLSAQDSANINYYNANYGYDANDDEDAEDSLDEDDELFADTDRFLSTENADIDENDDHDGSNRRVLRRKGTHDSQGNSNGSAPSSPGVGFDKRKSLKIARLPLTLISQNSWWDSETNPNSGSPQDSPSDIYASSSPSQHSPHTRLARSLGRTPRSRMNRTKFSSQHTAPLPSRPGLSMMSHPSNLDSARISTPPATFDALPPLIPKSARGRESSADNSPFALMGSASILRSGSTASLASSGNLIGNAPSGSNSAAIGVSSSSVVTPSLSSRSSTRSLLIASKNSQQTISTPTRAAVEKLFSNLVDRQYARYQQYGRFGADPVRGDAQRGAISTNSKSASGGGVAGAAVGYPDINYRALVSQSVAAKKALSDSHRTRLWQAHPSRRGDLEVPYLHLSPFGLKQLPSSMQTQSSGNQPQSAQISPVNIPVLQAWASALAARPRESNRANLANSPIFHALLESLGHVSHFDPSVSSTSQSSSYGIASDPHLVGSVVHTLSLLDVPSFVSLLATEFTVIPTTSSSSSTETSESKKSPRKAALVHTFATWLFPTARKPRAREPSVSPRSGANSLSGALKKDLHQGRVDRELGDSLHQNTTTPSAAPSARQTMRSGHSPLHRVRHLQHLLKLSQEIQNPKVLFKLSFLLYLCMAHRPKQASEVFAIIFERLAASAPKPEDEVAALSANETAGGAMSDDETTGPSSNSSLGGGKDNAGGANASAGSGTRARSTSASSSTQQSVSELSSSTATLGASGSSSAAASLDRASDSHAYAARQALSDSFESAIYSTLFLLNYGRSCPVEYHTWHKAQLPEFPAYKSAAMMPNAYNMFSARGANPNDLSAASQSLHPPVSASSSSSMGSESYLRSEGGSIPSSSTSSSATGSSLSTISSTSGIGHQRSNSNNQTVPSLGFTSTVSTAASATTGGGGTIQSDRIAGHHVRSPSNQDNTANSSSSSSPPTWEIKDTATRLALCVDRAHQIQLVARFVFEALGPSATNLSSTASSTASSASSGASSHAGTSGGTTSSPNSRSGLASLYSPLKSQSSLPFPFPVQESPNAFSRRLFESWRSEVNQIVHILTKNLRDELGTESSSDSSSDDSDIVHNAAKTMPNLPSESARIVRFLLGRTGLGSRSRLTSSLSHFTVSWLLQFDHHVNFWQSACQIDLMKEESNSGSLVSPNAKQTSSSASSGLKITLSNELSMEGLDLDEERLASSTTSSTFSGGYMPASTLLHSELSPRLSVALNAAQIRMVLQRPGAKFVEFVNHALKSKLVHVRQFAANLVDLCMNHDPVAVSTGGNTIYHVFSREMGPSHPVSPSSTSISASLDKSASYSAVMSSRGGGGRGGGSGASVSLSAFGSSHGARLASLLQPQPWLVLWMARLGGLAILEGLTHGLPMRTTIPGYGPLERSAFAASGPSFSSLSLTSPRGLGSSSSANSLISTPSGGNNSSPSLGERSPQAALPKTRRTSVSVTSASSLLRGSSGIGASAGGGAGGGSPAKPKPLQQLSRSSTINHDSALATSPSSASSNLLLSSTTSASGSAAVGGGSARDSRVGRQSSVKDVKLHVLQREAAIRQQQRQRALWSNYQTVPSISAQVWHCIFWKVFGPALALFDPTTLPMQFIAGKTQLSSCPLWMHPHAPADHSHALLDHLTYSNVPGASPPLDKLEGTAMILGGTSNPNQVRWSWEGAQGVPLVSPPPPIPTPPPTGSAQPIFPPTPSNSSSSSSSSSSSYAADAMALMHPFASLEPALLHDAATTALRDAKLFHRTLGRLFKSEAGGHATLLASTLVMVASCLRRQSLIVPKYFSPLTATEDGFLSISSSSTSPSSNSGSTSSSSSNPSLAQQLHKASELSLSADHILRLLVFVTTPVPTHMHAASTTAASAFFRETNSNTMPLSARDSPIASSSSGVSLPHVSGNMSSGSMIGSVSNAGAVAHSAAFNFANGLSSSLSLLPIGGERASFFRVRTASIRLLQLLLTSTPIMNWLSGSVTLPIVASPPGTMSNSAYGNLPIIPFGTSTLSSAGSISHSPTTSSTPFSSKPSTPQASGGGGAVSPLALSEVSQSSPSRRGKKGITSKDKSSEKDKHHHDKESKDSASSLGGTGATAGRRRKLGGTSSGAQSLTPLREHASSAGDLTSPISQRGVSISTNSSVFDGGLTGSPDSGPSMGPGGPGGMIVGRSTPSTSGGAHTSSGATGVPLSSNIGGANNSTSGASTSATVTPLSLKGSAHLFASSSTPSPLGSTPSSLENALTPLLSANTSPPVTPRSNMVVSSMGTAGGSLGGTPPQIAHAFGSGSSLNSSSDSIASLKHSSSNAWLSSGLNVSSASIARDFMGVTAESSTALWISIIEGLISVIRFGADVSSAMAASECLRSIVFARASVMDVFIKPLLPQVQSAFTPLLREKKDKKGGSTMISIEELILQARQSGASRHHGGGGNSASGSVGSGSSAGGVGAGVGVGGMAQSSSSNATSVSNYTTPSSWLVCTRSSTAPSSTSTTNYLGASTSSLSSHGQQPTWAVPTLEASLSILLRLHASLSVGQTQTSTTSLFTHLMDGLNITQPLPHIANCLYALNQLLAGPIAPMPPSVHASSSSASSFTATHGSSSSSSGSTATGSGFGSGSHGFSASSSSSSIPSTPANANLNSAMNSQHATYLQATRLQKQLFLQFASSHLFAKLRTIFNRLMEDEFIKSIVDPAPLPQSSGFFVHPHPASSSSATVSSDSTPTRSASSQSQASGGKSGGSKKSSKETMPTAASTPPSAPSSTSSSSSSPSSKKTPVSASQQSTQAQQLRTPQISTTVLASHSAPGAYLAFLQLVTLCHTVSLNHKIMKAAKTSPDFIECIKLLSRFHLPK